MSEEGIRKRLRDALANAATIHAQLKMLRDEGHAKDELYEEMAALRRDGLSEEEDDVALEGMDFLVGFCGPDAQID